MAAVEERKMYKLQRKGKFTNGSCKVKWERGNGSYKVSIEVSATVVGERSV